MTREECASVMALLRGLWPRQPIQRETVAAYSLMLADLDFEAVKRATLRLATSSRHFPTVAEIRDELVSEDLADMPEPELAWGVVKRAIGLVGYSREPEFDDEAIGEAVEAIGWRTICLDENEMSTRARFIDAYRAVYRRERRQAAQGPHALPGGRKELSGRVRAKELSGAHSANERLSDGGSFATHQDLAEVIRRRNGVGSQ